jgi:hypothetical protein
MNKTEYVLPDGRPVTRVREASASDIKLPGYRTNSAGVFVPGMSLVMKLPDDTGEAISLRSDLIRADSPDAKVAIEQRAAREQAEKELAEAELEAMTPEERAAYDARVKRRAAIERVHIAGLNPDEKAAYEKAEKARVAALSPADRVRYEAEHKHAHAPTRHKGKIDPAPPKQPAAPPQTL